MANMQGGGGGAVPQKPKSPTEPGISDEERRNRVRAAIGGFAPDMTSKQDLGPKAPVTTAPLAPAEPLAKYTPAAHDPMRDRQTSLLQHYLDLARGVGTSSDNAVRMAAGQAGNMALGTAAGVRGMAAGAALRAGNNVATGINQAAVLEARAAKLNEQRQAAQDLASAAAAVRGQDTGQAAGEQKTYMTGIGLIDDLNSQIAGLGIQNEDFKKQLAYEALSRALGIDLQGKSEAAATRGKIMEGVGAGLEGARSIYGAYQNMPKTPSPTTAGAGAGDFTPPSSDSRYA